MTRRSPDGVGGYDTDHRAHSARSALPTELFLEILISRVHIRKFAALQEVLCVVEKAAKSTRTSSDRSRDAWNSISKTSSALEWSGEWGRWRSIAKLSPTGLPSPARETTSHASCKPQAASPSRESRDQGANHFGQSGVGQRHRNLSAA